MCVYNVLQVCVCVCECVYVMLSPVVSSTAKIYYEGSKLPVASLSLSLSLSRTSQAYVRSMYVNKRLY